MKKLKNPYIIGGLIVIVLVVAGVLFAEHDADAKAATYLEQRSTSSILFQRDIALLTTSKLINKDDTDLAPKQRAGCNQALTLQYKLTSMSALPATRLNFGKLVSNKYRSAQKTSEATKSANKNAQDVLKKYYDICNYYVTDNEYSYQDKQIVDSPEYKAQLTFDPPACSTKTGCVAKDHYQGLATIYDKKNKIIQERNAKFKDMKCPFDTPAQKTFCDKFNHARTVYQQTGEQYVAALRASDTNKLSELSGANSTFMQAVKEQDEYARTLDPTLPTEASGIVYFAHQLADLEKQLRSITI